jgi:hypothetical protein
MAEEKPGAAFVRACEEEMRKASEARVAEENRQFLGSGADGLTSCRERGDSFQNCHACPDGTCGDNLAPKGDPGGFDGPEFAAEMDRLRAEEAERRLEAVRTWAKGELRAWGPGPHGEYGQGQVDAFEAVLAALGGDDELERDLLGEEK